MATVPLKLTPNVNTNYTPTLNQAGISNCQFIRFDGGLPQKLGGWDKFYNSNVSGVPKAMHAWSDLNSIDHLAVGTTQKLNVITSDVLIDITPQQFVSDVAPDFTTVASSATVVVIDTNIANVTIYDTVFFNTPVSVGGFVLRGAYAITVIGGATTYDIESHVVATGSESNAGTVPEFTTVSGNNFVNVELADHGQSVDDYFTFPISTTVGGLAISGTYKVVVVTDADNFTISSDSNATSSTSVTMNGGNAQILYYINLGPAASGTGFGVGGFGVGGFGSGSTSSSQTGTPITATNWSEDNWGETLMACPFGGGIYTWTPNTGFVNAGLIATAPIFNGGIFIAMPEQILVAWGSVANGEQRDPLWINWSNALDYTEWRVMSTTQAGGFRIPTGSRIVGALQGQHQAIIFTDVDAWVMQYLGPPLIYGFNKVGASCGLIGQHALMQMRGQVLWMSSGNFFRLAGQGVEPIPCTVWDVVFQDLDTANQDKCIAAPNSQFDEAWWFYPSISGGTGEIDSYVKYNLEEGSWDFGKLDRTAWIDQTVLGQPIGASSMGVIYQHETSLNADGAPLVWFFTTGWFVISEAEDMAFVDWMFPDFRWGLYGSDPNATVTMTIETVSYPNGPVTTFGPYSLSAAVEYVNLRLRGRQIRLTFGGDDLNSFARLGLPRYRMAKDGRL